MYRILAVLLLIFLTTPPATHAAPMDADGARAYRLATLAGVARPVAGDPRWVYRDAFVVASFRETTPRRGVLSVRWHNWLTGEVTLIGRWDYQLAPPSIVNVHYVNCAPCWDYIATIAP